MAKNREFSEPVSIFREWRGRFFLLGLVSVVMSLISLSIPLYMFNLYDRVLPARSVETLISLTIITLFVLSCFAGFDWTRSLIQNQMGRILEERIRPKLMSMAIRLSSLGQDVRMKLAKLDEFKTFVTSAAFIAIFDLVFVPIYFATLYLIHPILLGLCLFFAIATVSLGLSIEWRMKRVVLEHFRIRQELKKNEWAIMSASQGIVPLGRIRDVVERFLENYMKVEESMEESNLVLGRVQSLNKIFIMIIQTLTLGVTCYLVLKRTVPVAALFAVNIIAMRALQPLFQIVSSLRAFNRALDSWKEISETIKLYEERESAPQPLFEPVVRLRSLTVLDPKQERRLLSNIIMDVDPGEIVSVTGETGAGKSTLLKVLAGLNIKYAGVATLDGKELKHWYFEYPNAFIGYLPQEVRFLNASIKENLTGELSPDMDTLVALCKEVGLHEDIARLKDGYETLIDPDEPQFSGGQIKLMGLVRALWREPKLIVLDEPTTGLDFEREKLVIEALLRRQKEGRAIVVATHSVHILRVSTKILWLKWGMTKAYGWRDQVLSKMAIVKGVIEKLPSTSTDRALEEKKDEGEANGEIEEGLIEKEV